MEVLQTSALPLGYGADESRQERGRTAPAAAPSSVARAGNRTRTGDPHLGKVVLYQLSYSRVGARTVPKPPTPVKLYFPSATPIQSHPPIRPLAFASTRFTPVFAGALAWAFVASAAAQEPYSVMVPRGTVRLEIGTGYSSFASVYGVPGGDGAARSLADFFGGPVGPAIFPTLAGFEAAVREATGGEYAASLGVMSSSVEKNSVRLPASLDVGVFDWLSAGVSASIVRNETDFVFHFASDSASANAGFSPGLDDPSEVSRFLSSLRTSINGYDSYRAGLCAAEPTSAGCRDATALLAGSRAFHEALATMYASPLAPLAGSAAGIALLARLAEFAEAFQAAGATSPGTLPLSGAPFSAEDLQEFVTNPAFGIAGNRPLSSWRSLWMLGDLELRANARWLDKAEPGYRLTAGGGAMVRLPTGTQDDPANFLDLGSGDRQIDVEARGWLNGSWRDRLGLWTDLRYGVQLPGTTERRVFDPGYAMAPASTLARLDWNPGDYFFAEVAPWLRLSGAVTVVAGYRHFRKGEDSFALSVPAPAEADGSPPAPDPSTAPGTLDPEVLVPGSGASTGRIVLGLVYNRTGGRSGTGRDDEPAPGDARRRPLEARAIYRQVVAGEGIGVPVAGSLEVGVRFYVGIWGG